MYVHAGACVYVLPIYFVIFLKELVWTFYQRSEVDPNVFLWTQTTKCFGKVRQASIVLYLQLREFFEKSHWSEDAIYRGVLLGRSQLINTEAKQETIHQWQKLKII